MFLQSAKCYHQRYLLLCVLFGAVLFITFFTYAPKDIYGWANNYTSETRTSHLKDPRRVLRVPRCFNEYSGDRDIVDLIRRFSSQCSTNRLTRLGVEGDYLTSAGIWKSLDGMTKNPPGLATTCPRKPTAANVPIPRTVLLSFPGSGNTWTRHLLQQLTGIQTGSVYPKSNLSQTAFPFEGEMNKVIATKSHRPPTNKGWLDWRIVKGKVKVQFDRLLILLRNPYAAAMAEFKRRRVGKVENLRIVPRSSQWVTFLRRMQRSWTRFLHRAFKSTLPSLVIFYEDLQSCLLPELVKMSSFLSDDHLNEFAFCCTLEYHEGAYHRAPSNQTKENLYPPELRVGMNKMIQDGAAFVQQRHPEVSKKLRRYILP